MRVLYFLRGGALLAFGSVLRSIGVHSLGGSVVTTSRSAVARLVSLVVSALLLVGVSLLSVVPKAYAATPGTISGTVLDAVSGLPLAGVTVATVGAPTSTTTTNGTGSYTLSLDMGAYSLSASLDGYAPKTSPEITVGDGAAVTGVNFTLQKYATVRGSITNSSGGGIGNVVIKLYDATTASANFSYEFTTPGSGAFEITHVVPGSYKVMYDASNAAYMTRWYNLASTRDLATVVTVAPDATVDLSTSLVTASSVAGRVVNGGGTGVADAAVYLLQNGALVAQTTTHADGSYLIGSIGGADQYTVQVDASGYVSTWYGNVPSWVGARHFALPDSSNITLDDIVMIPGGSISGTMTPGDVAFSYVSASEPGVGGYSASVTAGGAYTIAELPTGTYDVTFHAPGYYPVTIPGVHVTAGTATTGISASLTAVTPGSGYLCTVTGKVVNLAGQGLPGVTVSSAGTRFTTTGADGSYNFQADSQDGNLNYALDGYVSQSTSSFCNGASIVVRDDVHLSRIVTIKGKVSTSDGPLAGATVYVHSAPNGDVVASATTAADGTYSITNLVEGQYTVAAFKDAGSGTSYPPVFYGGGSSLATASFFSAPEGSSATNVNFLLYVAGSISGTVSVSDGGSTEGAQVTVWSKDFTKTVVAGAGGTFTVGGLPAGTYLLSGYLTKWASVSQQVVLTEGEAVSGTTIELGNGYAVSGIISVAGPPATPLAHATVYLRTSDGKTDSVVANENGEYVFRGVPPGTYTVGTALGSDAWWLGGAKTPEHAATFSVADSAVTNVDITIPRRHLVTVTVLLPGGSDHATSGSVAAYDSFGDYGANPTLSDQGVATAQLWPGTYTLTVTVPGYPRATASVLVTDAATATTVTLAAGGGLTTVKDAGSTAAGASLVALEVATGLSTTGTNQLTGLAPGAYVVGYYPVDGLGTTCGPLVWYGGTSYLDASRVQVVAPLNTELTVHATCAPPTSSFTIAGTVTAPAGVTLTAGRVSLYLTDATGVTNDQTQIADAGGFAFTNIPAGSYTIDVSDGDLQLVDATIAVHVTGDTTISIPMVLGGTATGRVVDSFGHEVKATVGLQGPGFGASEYTLSGRFSIAGLQAGDYVMEIVPVAPYTKVTLSPVHVTLGGTTDVGIVTVQVGGRITGHLPSMYGLYANATIEAVDGSGRVLASTTGQAGNDYALWGVPAGTTYVRFSGTGLVTTWWRTGSSLATAAPVQVVPNGAVSGIDPTFELVVVPTTTISGTVLGADGPMSGVGVTANGALGGGGSATTAADGTYTMTVPAGDTYGVSAGFCFGQMGELSCYGQFVQATTTATVGTSPVTGVDLVFGTAQAAFTLAPVPTVAGDAVVGATLTATVGTWDPTPTTTTLQWLADGIAIPQATGTTLVLTPDLLGKHIAVQVTGTRTGYALTSRTSVPTAAVMPIPVVAGQPTFSGTPVVGTPVTVDPGIWSPADATLTYSWTRGATLLSTGATYTPTADDAGLTLAVTVMGTKDGQSSLVTITSDPVLKGTLTPGTVTVSGDATIGSTLSAATTPWGPAPVDLTYQWLRNGTAISGATQSTYAVTAADVSAELNVTATGTKPGYVDAPVTSAPVTVGLLTMSPATITVVGTPKVGRPLSASVTGWPTGTAITISWMRNGAVVGTGAGYTPTAADASFPLTVTATGTLAGYNDGTAYQPLGPVQLGDIAGTVAVTGNGVVGTTVTAAATWTPSLVPATTYTWQRNGVTVGSGATYLVDGLDHGATLSVVATSATGVLGYSVTPASATVTVVPGTITGSVAISGTPAVGQTLTATGSLTPGSASVSYTWLRDGGPAGVGTTYTVALADAGHTIAFQAMVTATGYTPATLPSGTVSIPLVAGTVSLPTATVGQAVTPTLSGWPDVIPTLSWSIDGRTESGATFTPAAADSGRTLTLVVTAAKAGFTSVSTTATTVVRDATMTAGAVAISPAPVVGETSSAVLSGWADGSTFTYSWLVDTTEVSTTSSYTPNVSDAGKQLTLTVTATKPGYGTAAGTSSASVAQGAITGGSAAISGKPAVGSTLTATSSGWTPAGVTVTYSWSRDGLPMSVTTDTYEPTLADVGHAFTVTATASATGYVSQTVTSAPTAQVPAVPMVSGQVTISGTAEVGSTLAASTTGWTPSTATVTFQWLRGGVAIPGATTTTYVPSLDDVGATVSVRGTATAPGYLTTSVTSAATPAIPAVALTPGTVTVTGAPAVGSALTAQPGTWSPSGASFTYQWLRDSSPIPTATGSTYTVALADVGAKLSVTVTGSLAGFTPTSATSGETAAVPPPSVVAGAVTISGTAAVGSTLTANPGAWAPADAALSYQWLRDGVAITGATAVTYTPATADLGLRLSVSVTGTRTGYTPATAVSAQTAIVSQQTVIAGTVAITGAPYALSTLTANPGTWSPATVRLSYQWLRDGVAIPGATGQTYSIPLTDIGHTLSVSVTGSRFGYVSATAVSAPTAPIRQQRVAAGTVTITGTPMVTSTLTAHPGAWTPANARLSYQWLRDGVTVPGATDQTYTPTTADTGHTLTVSVTGTRFGYVSATAVSAPTAPVQAAHVVAGTVTITGTATAGSRLRANAGTWTPVNVNLSYQWLRDGVAIAGANGTRYTVALADVGHALSVKVTGTHTGFVPATATSAPTAVVPPAQVAAGNVMIQGRAVQGSFLLAQTWSWSQNVSLSYQWMRDGVAIPAARRWYYQVTTQDVGHVLTVVVTGTEQGYLPVSVTSAPTATVR